MKEIQIGDKTYTLKEIKYKDLTSMSTLSQEEVAKKLMLLSSEITEEEYDNLSLKDGITLQTAINELNGLVDFQSPLVK